MSVSDKYINVHRVLNCTESEGPGKRFCIWTQGCVRHCPGCCNQLMQPIIPVHVYSVPVLQAEIARAVIDYNIEGITFLGGEPIIQAMGLAELAAFAQLQGLSVIIFTGFTMEQLKKDNLPGVNKLLGFCDVVIDGCFKQENPDLKRNWVGSTNQTFHYLTNRYNQKIETNKKYCSSIEVRISTEKIQGNGCPFALESILNQTDET